MTPRNGKRLLLCFFASPVGIPAALRLEIPH
jgi:hypothetical protein